MKRVKWIFVVLLFSSLTAFVAKDKPTTGLSVGDKAPDFQLEACSGRGPMTLDSLRGRYVLLSFWASYDAASRRQNARLCQALRRCEQPVEAVSVSFDDYYSVFAETVRQDGLDVASCYVETDGESSALYRTYRLNRGFHNFLLDGQGVILAKDVDPARLSSLLQ